MILAVEDYQKFPKSTVGVKRAADLADALRAMGYDVTFGANPSNAAARASLRDFSQKAETADVALVFLIGHGATWSGQTFFLPANAEIGRAADLLSRGISVPNVAQIAGKAEAAGVFVLTTAPDLETPVDGIEKRPQFSGATGKNVVAVLPSSGRVPVSRIDAMSEQAADALIKAFRQPDVTFAEAVRAGGNGDNGFIIGTPANMSLKKPVARIPKVENATLTAVPPRGAAKADDADRNVRSEQAKAEVERAQADVQRAQAEAQKAQADAERAHAEAQKAIADAERMKAEARRALASATPAAPASAQSISVQQQSVDEHQIGKRQRQHIQERLKDMGLYTGPIDSIMGPLTREAIMGFQKNRGASVSGYLTPDQYEVLLGSAQ